MPPCVSRVSGSIIPSSQHDHLGGCPASPALATWIREHVNVDAVALRDIELRDARDPEIFQQAKEAGAVVMTKDKDFVDLLYRHGPPPQVIWVTAGNTSNDAMRKILTSALTSALRMLQKGEALVEITG